MNGFNGYRWDGGFSPDFAEMLLTVGILIFIVFAIGMLIGVVFWVLRSIALYTLAKNRGMENPGLSWIPAIGVFRIGSIADSISMTEGRKTFFGAILLVGSIAGFCFGWASNLVPLARFADYGVWGFDSFGSSAYSALAGLFGFTALASIISIAVFVIQVIALNKIFKHYRPGNATLWTVLSAIPLTAFLSSVFLFMIRNDAPRAGWGYNAGYGYPIGDFTPQNSPPYPPPYNQPDSYSQNQPYAPPGYPTYVPPPPPYAPPFDPRPWDQDQNGPENHSQDDGGSRGMD